MKESPTSIYVRIIYTLYHSVVTLGRHVTPSLPKLKNVLKKKHSLSPCGNSKRHPRGLSVSYSMSLLHQLLWANVHLAGSLP